MYLLNFERTMNQIFSGENDFLYENYLQLGIRSREVEYQQNEAGTITCFVQEGDLWSYNQASGRLAEVFSFRGHEGIDARENYMQHDIRILNIDEAGDIDYVVYGYMNRGVHEGEMGISFLHYSASEQANICARHVPRLRHFRQPCRKIIRTRSAALSLRTARPYMPPCQWFHPDLWDVSQYFSCLCHLS